MDFAKKILLNPHLAHIYTFAELHYFVTISYHLHWCWLCSDVNSFCGRLFMGAISIFHHGWVTAIEKVFSSPRRNVSIFFGNILRSVTKSNVLFAVYASTASNIVSLRLIQSTWFHFKNISVWDSFEMFLKSFCPLSRIWIFVSGCVWRWWRTLPWSQISDQRRIKSAPTFFSLDNSHCSSPTFSFGDSNCSFHLSFSPWWVRKPASTPCASQLWHQYSFLHRDENIQTFVCVKKIRISDSGLL